MGAFYTNISVRASSRDDVLPLLAGRSAFVSSSSGGYVTVYDKQCDEGGLYPVELAAKLSRQLGSVAFLVTVHDDDILYFDVFDRGDKVDEYDSCPNYFSDDEAEDLPPEGGNPVALCRTFGCAKPEEVEEILFTRDEESPIWIFATERHRALAKLLGLPECSIGYGYKYLSQGEVPPGLANGDLVELRP